MSLLVICCRPGVNSSSREPTRTMTFAAKVAALRSFMGVPDDAPLPSWVMLLFFYYFTLFVNVVLLNVLIAIIGDTYERVQEKFRSRSLLQRAQLLLDHQLLHVPAGRTRHKYRCRY